MSRMKLCLLLFGRRMKRKEKIRKKSEAAGDFFPRTRAVYNFLAVPGRIFAAVRCN
jgi:hypothetical protein